MTMEQKSAHDGHRGRMRQRILDFGIESLQPHEVLEYLLYPFIPRKNTNDIAHALIDTFGSFAGVLNADIQRLTEINGMTDNAALFLNSLPDVFRCYSVESAKFRDRLCGRGKAREYLRAKLYGKPIEEIYVAAVDAHDNLIQLQKISSGSGDAVNVPVRSIVDFALATKASGILLAHNHPSGKVTPSNGDVMMTREILWTLDSISVTLQDHYIFGGDECYSFEENGKIDVMIKEKDTTLKDGMLFYDRKG